MSVNEQGVNLERYMMVPRTLIFLSRGSKLLLIKGSPQKRLWPNLYNGIGGHIEPGEDILSAAYRELAEETGLIPDELWLSAIITINTMTNPGVVLYVFRGQCSQGEPIPSLEGTVEWINIKQLNQIPLVEDLPMLIAHIMAIRKGAPPLLGHYSYNTDGKMITSFRDR